MAAGQPGRTSAAYTCRIYRPREDLCGNLPRAQNVQRVNASASQHHFHLTSCTLRPSAISGK
eukprot:3030931-Heterocapsa_arctica.AAC.1